MSGVNPWQSVPRKATIAFLFAVFFTFATTGFANDIIDMGRQPQLRFGVGVLLSGLFAVGYAASSIALRRRFWMAVVPLFFIQGFVMAWLGRSFPDAPHPVQMGAAELARLQSRFFFDGVGVIVAVALGYAGFIYVSVSEARRHARAQTEKALLESEMVAARQVQQLILPGQDQSFPGYAVESVYQPARQVGGDFFQIFPVGKRGLLIVVGDVAGKGVPAAMLVSLLVGSIRATADDTHDPVLMLRRLHEHLTWRTAGGFSTALSACIADDGRVTIANAGHLSPYLDGRELDLPGALPLGVAGGGEYEITNVELRPGSRLVFVSDGVVEAQNQAGELFGFDRARAISIQPAAAIVDAAMRFGQSDDITVVTIERLPTSEARDQLRSARVLTPA